MPYFPVEESQASAISGNIYPPDCIPPPTKIQPAEAQDGHELDHEVQDH